MTAANHRATLAFLRHTVHKVFIAEEPESVEEREMQAIMRAMHKIMAPAAKRLADISLIHDKLKPDDALMDTVYPQLREAEKAHMEAGNTALADILGASRPTSPTQLQECMLEVIDDYGEEVPSGRKRPASDSPATEPPAKRA